MIRSRIRRSRTLRNKEPHCRNRQQSGRQWEKSNGPWLAILLPDEEDAEAGWLIVMAIAD